MSNNNTAPVREIGPPVEADIEAEHHTDLGTLLDNIITLFPRLSKPCQYAVCANVEALAALAAA